MSWPQFLAAIEELAATTTRVHFVMAHAPDLVLLDLAGRLLVEPAAAEGGIIFFIDRPETGRGGGFVISPSFFGTVEWQPYEMLRIQGSGGYPTFTLRPCSTA